MSKKDELLKVAAELFAQKGYAETSIDEIVQAANVAKGTLFYHFKTKGDLLAEIMSMTFGKFHTEARKISRKNISGIDKITDLSRVSLRLIKTHPNEIKTLVRDVPHEVLIGGGHPINQLAIKSLSTILAIYEDAIRSGIADGTIREMEPCEGAVILHAFVVGRAKTILLRPYDITVIEQPSEEFIRKGFESK